VSPNTPELVSIPPGLLARPASEGGGAEPAAVAAFRLGATQVTNGEYDLFVGETRRPAPPTRSDPHFCDPRQPVVSVSWFDAAAYCGWLGRRLGLPIRLPTEDEWEWAARGGRVGALYPWGDEPPEARYPDHDRLWRDGPEPVGRHLSNGWGLHEMCENTHEWCANWFDASGTRRASKGGSWRHARKVATCAARSSIPPEFRYADYGFRVAS
jgi:formylglycine-generating enzyme required for sulfatase activity